MHSFCRQSSSLRQPLPETQLVAERVSHFHDAAPVLVAHAGARMRIALRQQFGMQGGDIINRDQQRCTRRGVAVMFGQVQHQFRAPQLQVERRGGVETVLPVDAEAQELAIEFARLGFRKAAQDGDGACMMASINNEDRYFNAADPEAMFAS